MKKSIQFEFLSRFTMLKSEELEHSCKEFVKYYHKDVNAKYSMESLHLREQLKHYSHLC